jgi:uncharacterized protein (TIGR01777 family)
MKILMTEATELIGKEIGKKFVAEGHKLVVITQNQRDAKEQLPFPCTIYEWNINQEEFPQESLQDVEAIIHLGRGNIANKRCSKSQKKEIFKSHAIGTSKLVAAVNNYQNSQPQRPKIKFIAASSIGIYGTSGSTEFSEASDTGSDLLAQACKEQESTLLDLNETIHPIILRMGIVLARHGGILESILTPFTLGVGGQFGSGKQTMSWIHLDDAVNAFIFFLNRNLSEKLIEKTEIYNIVSPSSVTNLEFCRELASTLGEKLFLPIPTIFFKFFCGENTKLLLGGGDVSCLKLKQTGFKFKFAELKLAVDDLLAPFKNGDKEILAEQWVPHSPESIFPFFSDEKNLEKLTPVFLNFKVLNKSTPTMQQGTLIDYRLSIHHIPCHWRTLIESWTPNVQFVDTQIKGPYQKWHHTHYFIPFAGGTLMRDVVHYRIPLGKMGIIFALNKIRKDINIIFSYRRKMICDLFF